MTDTQGALTDAEWRAFQALPDQGHSHRAWIDARIEEAEARAIAAFLSHMSADYRKHTAEAAREDMIVACARFGVDPAWFYTDEDQLVDAEQARSLRADVAHYRIMEGLE